MIMHANILSNHSTFSWAIVIASKLEAQLGIFFYFYYYFAIGFLYDYPKWFFVRLLLYLVGAITN